VLTLVDAAGAQRTTRVATGLSAQLRADDWLRARPTAGDAFEVFCAYPPQSARLRPEPES